MNYHEKYKHFYCSKEWQRLRKIKFVDANGLCEQCLKEGKVVQAKEIHHKVPIDVDWGKRLDYNNLIALCSHCHNKAHERVSPLQKFLQEFDNIENNKKGDN